MSISKLMGEFKKGDVIKFDIINKKITDDGLSSGRTSNCDGDEIFIYQNFYITNYPSWNDFGGSHTKIKHDTYAMVLRSIGIPWKLELAQNAVIYEVYEVLTSKLTKRCVLAFNMKKAFK